VRFLPKDEGFFDLFDSLSARLLTSATLLRDLFNDPNRLEELAGKIKQEEHGADATTYEILQRIDRSFVTPLDREDIHLLANRLDNVVDLIDGTARRATMFHIKERRDQAIALIDVLVSCTASLGRGVKNVRKSEEVHKVAREVKALEERADSLYAKAIGELFSGNPNPLDVIKWKEIYDNLEHAVDECEDVANVLESISLKNS
jgi:predicted phosphate transport protein (TIGR00153 family)